MLAFPRVTVDQEVVTPTVARDATGLPIVDGLSYHRLAATCKGICVCGHGISFVLSAPFVQRRPQVSEFRAVSTGSARLNVAYRIRYASCLR